MAAGQPKVTVGVPGSLVGDPGTTREPGMADRSRAGVSAVRATLIFVVAAGVALGSSWLLVSRLERLGERLGLSEALLGFVAALAADAPEITAAATALLHHQAEVGAGVVLGSCPFNLAALLGLGALVAGRIGLHRRVVVFEGSVALALSVLAARGRCAVLWRGRRTWRSRW